MKKLISIEGMSCGHCAQAVTNTLKELKGVTGVAVDLEKKLASVELSGDAVSDDVIKEEIEEAGYSVTDIVSL